MSGSQKLSLGAGPPNILLPMPPPAPQQWPWYRKWPPPQPPPPQPVPVLRPALHRGYTASGGASVLLTDLIQSPQGESLGKERAVDESPDHQPGSLWEGWEMGRAWDLTASLPPQLDWGMPTSTPSSIATSHKRERRHAFLRGPKQPSGLQDPVLVVSSLCGLQLGSPLPGAQKKEG